WRGYPHAGRWGAVVVLAVALLLTAACGGGSQAPSQAGGEGSGDGEPAGEAPVSPPTPAEPPVTLTVIGPWAGAEMEQFMPALEAAEEALKLDIEYRIYRAEDLQSVLPPQFAAQQAPGDVIFMWDWWIRENAQHAVDLSDIWEAESGNYLLQAAEADGRVVAVPYAMSVKPGFWYKKSFFEAHGLEPPSDWDGFMALLDQIAAIEGITAPIASGDGVGWPLSDVTEHFLIAFGGPDLQHGLISGDVAWTDPEVRQIFTDRLVPALEYFGDPVEWTQGVELWWNEEYALYFMGNWITGMVENPDDLGVFPLPGTRGVVAGTDYAFVPAYSRNIDAARDLVAFLISREGMLARAAQGGKLTGRTDIDAGAYPPADAALAQALAEVEETLPDLDDTVGGDWQAAFWDQLKLLWVDPSAVDEVLEILQEEREAQ
ncbi:MAG TPA: ABC transporter substrate-binding protein, partial [Bacillota bacterium]